MKNGLLFILLFSFLMGKSQFNGLYYSLAPNYTLVRFSDSKYHGLGFSTELGSSFKLNDRFSFTTGINYQMRHFNLDITNSFSGTDYLSESKSLSNCKYHYINLPIIFSYRIGNKLEIGIGPKIGKALSYKWDQTSDYTETNLTTGAITTEHYTSIVKDKTENYYDFAFSGNVHYSINSYLGIHFRYQQTVAYLAAGSLDNNQSWKLMQLGVVYSFLKKSE